MLKVADVITVVRAGRTVASVVPHEVTADGELAELMVGSEPPKPDTRVDRDGQGRARRDGLTVIEEVRGVGLDHVSFDRTQR